MSTPLTIRAFVPEDKEQYLAFSRSFYQLPAVQHAVPEVHFERTFEAALQNSPYVRADMLEWEGKTAGYGLLSLTYSNEAGGIVLWAEELFILPEFQGKGIGKTYLEGLPKRFPQAARIRLEVSESNVGAQRLYQKLGYTYLEYLQMVQEFPQEP